MIKELKDLTWKQGLAIVSIGAAVGIISGCSKYFMKVDTPAAAVDLGFPEKTTLAETPVHQDAFLRWSDNIVLTWEASEALTQQRADMIDGLVGSLASPESLASFGFNPYGAAGSSFLLLINTLLGNRRTRTEKEASYNAGLDKGKALNERQAQNV